MTSAAPHSPGGAPPSPGGTADNSPAVYCRDIDASRYVKVPEGRLKTARQCTVGITTAPKPSSTASWCIQSIVLTVTAASCLLLPLAGCGSEARGARDGQQPRMLVLGFDGMDPKILTRMLEAGRMPNFAKVAAVGTYKPLATSMPPQSPVAWSNFISGSHSGKHQIYDFIHRRLESKSGLLVDPYLSTSATEPKDPPWILRKLSLTEIPWLGDWRIPLTGDETLSLRRGGAFWDDLVANSVDTVIYRVPANFPASVAAGPGSLEAISGMGTPDLFGNYGEFWKFDEITPSGGRDPSGGHFRRLTVKDHRAVVKLEGPENYLRKPDADNHVERMELEFEVVRDPSADVVRIQIGDEVLLLKEGEWSDWVRLRFETGIPGSTVLAAMQLPTSMPFMIRIYMKSVHPQLEFYITPYNIDPLDAVTPISTPTGFAADIAHACGCYYTTGIPEDVKALRSGALNEDEFLQQARILLAERKLQYRRALSLFKSGYLFFYFGSTDQLAHIFWRDTDPDHPGLRPGEAKKYGSVIEDTYAEMDELVGEALAVLNDDDTLIIMSDHGFNSFRRGFNVNTWLINNRYMNVSNPATMNNSSYLQNVVWEQTQAYAIGLNALYINVADREPKGIVSPGEQRRNLMEEIAAKLVAVRDLDGEPVIDTVYITEDEFPGADPLIAPDMLVGYALNYRASWATAVGGTPFQLIEDNMDRWSGDHCIAAHLVPGIIVTNRKLNVDDPSLSDLAPTMLSAFGIAKPDAMDGRVIFAKP